jgi:O-acetyl-ADP-ribose deacetylase (regulator of RNase III)
VFHVYGTRIDIRALEPAKAGTEGLVVPANDHLWMGTGTALQLKQVGGETIELEAVRLGPLGLGSAVATGAGSLALQRIYHAVVMGQDLKVSHEQLAPALTAALALAAKDRIGTLAIAPLESEDLIGPFHEAARRVVATLFEALGNATQLRSIVLIASKSETREAYRNAFHQVISGSHG